MRKPKVKKYGGKAIPGTGEMQKIGGKPPWLNQPKVKKPKAKKTKKA